MKCVFVGNFVVPYCSEVHESLSLEELGVEVIRLQENEVSNAEILASVQREKPDLVFFVHTWSWGEMDFDTLAKIKAYCPTVYYHLDLIRGIPDRENTVDSSWWYKCDDVFMPDGDKDTISWFAAKGVNYHYSPPGVFHKGVYLAEPDPALKQDVIFVGSRNYHPEYPYRQLLIAKLEERYGSRFTLWEHSSQMREHKLNTLYASAKVAVGDTFCPGFNRKRYFSDRLTETAGRGCFQVFPYIQGIEELYEPEKEIITYQYGDFFNLFNLIDFYLDHDDEREKIKLAAFERTKKEHCYTHRMQNVLDVVIHGKPNQFSK